MKKHLKSALCVLCILVSLLTCCVLVSAATADMGNISVAETANGSVKLAKSDDGKALVTLQPNKGYLTASVKLKADNGQYLKLTETDTANVYSCAIPESSATLTAEFRRTDLTLNKEELAMSSGKTACVSAKLAYVDGDLHTRVPVKNNEVVFSSTDPDVVSVDPATGKLTAHKMGYARITASACAGNGVEDYFYVIVDGDKDEVVGTLQLNAWFEEKVLIEDKLMGHSFLIFTNTSGEPITIDVSGMYECYVPTAEYDKAVKAYGSTGYDPLTFYYVTQGEAVTDKNEEIRKAYADTLLTEKARGELENYVILPNDIATFDNSGPDRLDEVLGDMQEVLSRYNILFDSESLKQQMKSGKMTLGGYVIKLNKFLIEISYDLHTGFNPLNGSAAEGGEMLNKALYYQAYNRDYRKAVGCKTMITRVQLMAMVDRIQYDTHFNILDDNCTSSAAAGWNLATVATPRYHVETNQGNITKSLSAPMWLRNDIFAKSVELGWDKNIEFIKGIGVVRP